MIGVVVVATAEIMWRLPHYQASPDRRTATTTPRLRPASTSTTVPLASPFEAADAAASKVTLYDTPGAVSPTRVLANPTHEHVPLVFLVRAHGPDGWLQVQIPQRPNGSTAWIQSSDVIIREVTNRIVVESAAKRLTVYSQVTGETLLQATVAVGSPDTPTPLGDFYVDATVHLGNPNGPYGSDELSVTGFSDVLTTFGGNAGEIAIHGTNQPDLIGQPVSHGCVRMTNDDVAVVAGLAPSGTPVTVLA